ncbi:hypothetical protein IFM53868_10764 [Aspergillus udagawae]|uniref:Uncharacterized protein n=1 Tax=Aspergillus udagawae TaxID=91492 RepID=A0ABQ1BF07_9EURO|nr:hypothetical protein IFM53868_10764 [Aspergillus udagawae]GFG20391.1 hypothetical protein IFM5058_10599 [Aspergillus udagawae]
MDSYFARYHESQEGRAGEGPRWPWEQKSTNRFLKALTPERTVERNNFFIQLDDGLYWSHRMGDQSSTEVASWATANSRGLTVDEIHFRSERQTL